MIAFRKWTTWAGGIVLAIYLLSIDGIRDSMGSTAKVTRDHLEDGVVSGFLSARESLGELEWTN